MPRLPTFLAICGVLIALAVAEGIRVGPSPGAAGLYGRHCWPAGWRYPEDKALNRPPDPFCTPLPRGPDVDKLNLGDIMRLFCCLINPVGVSVAASLFAQAELFPFLNITRTLAYPPSCRAPFRL